MQHIIRSRIDHSNGCSARLGSSKSCETIQDEISDNNSNDLNNNRNENYRGDNDEDWKRYRDSLRDENSNSSIDKMKEIW